MSKLQNFLKGLIKENPVLVLVLGTCPTLAISTSVIAAFGMGIAATAVLILSNMAMSAIRKIVPDPVRIPCYIVVIASLVTVVEMVMKAFVPALYESLGIFIPLIVVNCIILGRAEAFAAKNSVINSVFDGLGMGLGFTLALLLVSMVRQIIGGVAVLSILPAGGFIVLGCLLALINALTRYRALRKGAPEPGPLRLDCRHCVVGCGREALER